MTKKQSSGEKTADWADIERLFDEALARPESERGAWLINAAGNNEALRAQVQSLLDADRAGAPILDSAGAKLIEPALSRIQEDEHPVPERIGQYRILRSIGAGGMSRVYLAERDDGVFEQQVAVKVMTPSGRDLGESRRRFNDERQILANLSHINVARILDGGVTEEGTAYLVMEYVDGRPVTDYCNVRALGIAQRLALFDAVCNAVDHAHRQLVVHRDLKPSNILVSESGEVKLLDFGIAKLLGRPDREQAQTRTGLLLLTPEYAAPEQIAGDPVTTATDVYGLGLLLYELLTGVRPFDLEGQTAATVENILLRKDAVPPSSAPLPADGPPVSRALLRGDLDVIVAKALRKEPARRYGSARELADDLKRYRSGRPIDARPATLAYRTAKFIGRNRLGVAVAMMVLASLGAGVATALWQARVAAEQSRLAVAQAARATETKDFLVQLFAAADPEQALGTDLTVGQILDTGAATISGSFVDSPELRGELLTLVASIYHNLAQYERARDLLGQADNALHLVDESVEARATHLYWSGLNSLSLGDGEAAQSFVQEALSLQNAAGLTVGMRADLAMLQARTMNMLGRDGDPLQFVRPFLSISIDDSREQDRIRGLAAFTSMDTLLEQGRYREAIDIGRAGAENLRRAFGPAHPNVSHMLSAIASAQQGNGDLDAAEQTEREALAQLRHVFGDEHPSTAVSLQNLAVTLAGRGRAADAIPLYREAIGIQRVAYGEAHLYTLTAMANLAESLRRLGRHDESVTGFAETLEIGAGALPDAHPTLNIWRVMHGRALAAAGKADEAEAPLRAALANLERVLDPNHPGLAQTRVELGHVLTLRGQPELAEPLLRDSLALLGDNAPASSFRTGLAALRLGQSLAMQERHEEAADMLARSIVILEHEENSAYEHELTIARAALTEVTASE